VSLSADASVMVTTAVRIVSNIWVAPNGDASLASQITKGIGDYGRVTFTPDGKILYTMRTGEYSQIWIMDADGSRQKQLTFGSNSSIMASLTGDGRYIVFVLIKDGKYNLWRINSDGSDLKQLTSGNKDIFPLCSPDGKWVYFVSATFRDWTIFKVAIDGGDPIELFFSGVDSMPAISPDGKLIAYEYIDRDKHQNGVIVQAIEGKPIKKFLNFSPARSMRWSSDGNGLLYDGTSTGNTEIWYQPINGDSPKQLTNFKKDEIFWFDWSQDGKQLVCSRGAMNADLIMLSNFK
jgi:Tol biopolymer transport system component